ncbi:hypothetical protein ACIQLJ_07630 [Microbacterium sp. NPDC091313]
MLKLRVTFAVVVIVGATVLLPAQMASAVDCQNPGWTTTCHANSGSQIDIVGSQTTPGSAGGTRPSAGGGGQAIAPPSGPAAPAVPPDDGCTEVNLEQLGIVDACPIPAEDDAEDEAPAPGIPPVTAQDLASFAPLRPPLQGEPAGVGVVGMPANFVAGVDAHSLAGTLFGRAVTVRFTPAAYVFDYGDGTRARSATGGASWSSLGQAQFSATPTSHAYAARGTYVASVTVEYAAEVDFGVGRWFPVRGLVTAASPGYPVEIYEVRTALVDKTCAENPAGPGC